MNRAGASVIDAALQAKKEDVTRLVGRDNIAGAWELQENADLTIIINPETKLDTGELFMTFKLLKRRYRSIEENVKLRRLEYFNQPFADNSEIKIMDDIHLQKPLALESLATQFVATVDKRGNKNATERKRMNRNNEVNKKNDDFEYEPFSTVQEYYG